MNKTKTAFALAACLTVAGCADTPYYGQGAGYGGPSSYGGGTSIGGINIPTKVGRIVGPGIGAAVGSTLTQNAKNRGTRILGATAGAAFGGLITDAFTPKRAPCRRSVKIDSLNGVTTRDQTNCNIELDVPYNTSPVRYGTPQHSSP